MKTHLCPGATKMRLFLLLLFLVLLTPPMRPATAAPDEYTLVTVTLESAFTERNEVPISWVEVMVFSKDPNTIEFFERPTTSFVGQSKSLLRLRPSDFPLKRMWVLYRLDESAAEKVTRGDVNQERLYESYRHSVWAFAVPFAPNLDQMSIKGTQLTYTLKGADARHPAAGTLFQAPLARRGRKGSTAYVRVDHRPDFKYKELAAQVNASLPTPVQLDGNNNRIWQAGASLFMAPKTVDGKPYYGPREYDRLVVERGYTPIFIVVNVAPEEAVLRTAKPWFTAFSGSEKEAYADLSREDPELWTKLPAEVRARYQVHASIKPGAETKIIVFWKSSQSDKPLPRYFFMFLRRASGEEFRTLVFLLAPAAAQ